MTGKKWFEWLGKLDGERRALGLTRQGKRLNTKALPMWAVRAHTKGWLSEIQKVGDL